MQTDSSIEKDGKVVGKVYVCGQVGAQVIIVKSVRSGRLQEFSSVNDLKARLEPIGCKLVVSYSQLPELKKLDN